MSDIYIRYSDILRNLYNLMNLTTDFNLKKQIRLSIINLIKELCVIDKVNSELYLDLLEEFNLDVNLKEFIVYENSNDKDNKNIVDNDEKYIINKDDNESLQIIKAKKSYNSELKNKVLSLLSLQNNENSNTLINSGLGISSYLLYKKGLKNGKSLIEKYGFGLDENDNLIDYDGKIITEDDIGRIKYNLVKKELTKNAHGDIDSNYKKNRLTSMLLNIPVIKKVKPCDIETSREEKLEVKEMNKGLGIIK